MNKYYQTLGLEEGASKEEIQAAYERLSRELNPSNNDNLEFFVEEFKLLQEAYKALTGEEPDIETASDTEKVDDVSDLFQDSNSIISILKKFRESGEAEKLEIIKSLEAFKSGNETYHQALAILYKKGDIKRIKGFEENENSPNLNIDNEVSHLIEDEKPITPPSLKPSKNTGKILLGALVFTILLFGITYIIFLIKVNTFKDEIPGITDESEYNQNLSRKIWETKFFENHPEIVNKHLTDGTNKGFVFNESERKFTKDSIINFFIYSKNIPLELYKPDFFQCVYYNAVNSDAYWNHYTVEQGKTKVNGEVLPPYLEMLERTKQNHRVSDEEFEDLIQMVGGLKSFQKEKPSSIDNKCKKCLENYQTTFETNTLAIIDFYNFTDEYLALKNKIDKQNASYLRKYDKAYRTLTTGMRKSVREKLNLKLKKKPVSVKKSISNVYSGLKEGLGNISYSIDQYQDNLTELKDYVNETYASYYSTNSLNTGATPYKYCYGRNPSYCSSYGYSECSFIDIKAPYNSDVVVIIKKYNRAYAHAYIKAGGYYKFKLGNGSFQTFFYYGKGWNPNKYIKDGSCGKITGGFVKNESLDKSDVIRLNNSSMSFTLYPVKNGNFKPKASNKNEAF